MAPSLSARPTLGWARRFGLAVALAACAALVAACSGTAGSTSSGPIKIGILWPFNGAYSNYGPDGLAGAQLALQQAGGSVNGRKVEIVQGNENVLDPSTTLTEAQRLVQQQGVSVMLGPVFGSSQNAVQPYLKANNVMTFVPFGATKELGGTGNVVSWPALDTSFSTPLGGYLANTLHYKTIATVAPDYVYGHDVLAGVTKTFTQAGGQVIQQQWVPLGTTDLISYVTNLNKSADALVMWLVPSDEATFVKDFRSLGLKIPIVFVNGVFDPTFQSMGSAIQGSYGIVDWSSGLTNAANQQFVAAFQKANNGQVPDTINAAAYVDMQLALAAIKEAHGSTAFSDLKAAVTKVKLETPYGPGSIDSNYFGVTDRTIVRATQEGGRWVWKPVQTYTAVPNGS